MYLEQQLSEGVGARVGFVYYTVDEPDRHLPAAASGAALHGAVHLRRHGRDGVAGTADDQNLTFYGIPNARLARRRLPDQPGRENAPSNGTYKTFEFAEQAPEPQLLARRRLRLHVEARLPADGYPNTPNGPFDYDYRICSFKANGTYNAPCGYPVSAPVFRFQAGANYARTLSVSAPASCACTFSAARGGSATQHDGLRRHVATPYNAYRQDNISVLDLRVEKTVNFGDVAEGSPLPRRVQPRRTRTRPRRSASTPARTSSSRPRSSDRGRAASASGSSGSSRSGRMQPASSLAAMPAEVRPPARLRHPGLFGSGFPAVSHLPTRRNARISSGTIHRQHGFAL